jgi:hypothetical protein
LYIYHFFICLILTQQGVCGTIILILIGSIDAHDEHGGGGGGGRERRLSLFHSLYDSSMPETRRMSSNGKGQMKENTTWAGTGKSLGVSCVIGH